MTSAISKTYPSPFTHYASLGCPFQHALFGFVNRGEREGAGQSLGTYYAHRPLESAS